MKCKSSRRNFLLGGAAAGAAGLGLGAFGGLEPLVHLARADNPDAPDLHFIFCYFSGGWDILVSLDPRDPQIFTPQAIPQTLIEPGYDSLTENRMGVSTDPYLSPDGPLYGPYLGDLGQFHSDRLQIVRGIAMETVSHGVGRRRFLTGKAPVGLNARGSSASTWLAGLLGQDNMIPNLAVRMESYNVDLPATASAIRVNSVPDLLRALGPSEAMLPEFEEDQVDVLMANTASCPKARYSNFWQQAESSRRGATELIRGDLSSYFEFSANTPYMEALRGHYSANGNNNLNFAEQASATAVEAITLGITRVASINIAGGFDTHSGVQWTAVQGPRQEAGWNLVARMAEMLDQRQYQDTGDSWLDHTVICCFSEFSRTPRLNASGGRDHHLTNACALLGGPIKGGHVIGASSDLGMGSVPTSLESGRPDPDGHIINPEHVLRTLMYAAGIVEDRADLRVPWIPSMLT
ncbi:MAG: DUF1501 domain-containing protein [Myxococcota bacterium]|nr:DUF1501 domain-containing protein [Myxococcota bacterium]